jgi:predicted methyltransferase
VLKQKGKLYAAHINPAEAPQAAQDGLKSYQAKLAANPEVYGNVIVTAFGANALEVAPPGSADMVVTFRNIHNWMGREWAPQAFEAAFRALKPGGVLGVVEHRGSPSVAQDPKAASGYVNEDYAISLIEAAGFVGRALGDQRHPKDTKD